MTRSACLQAKQTEQAKRGGRDEFVSKFVPVPDKQQLTGRYMRRKFLALMIVLPLLGCTRPEEDHSTRWELLALPGKSLILIDDKELQFFDFHEGGAVIAEIGRKGGPVAGPILIWKIQGNALLISVTPDSEIIERLSAPTIKGSILTATRKSGAKAQYQFGTISTARAAG